MTQTESLTDAQRVWYAVEFYGPTNESAWWGCYFTEVGEATRWADWELERIAHEELGWSAEVLAGHWVAGEFVADATVATVGPREIQPG